MTQLPPNLPPVANQGPLVCSRCGKKSNQNITLFIEPIYNERYLLCTDSNIFGGKACVIQAQLDLEAKAYRDHGIPPIHPEAVPGFIPQATQPNQI